jgi:biliverdin reductase
MTIRVGVVGTGFAAKERIKAFQQDDRTKLVAIAGYTPTKTQELADTFQVKSTLNWQSLIKDFGLDLIVISNINSLHGEIAAMALSYGLHVIVEYPLCLEIQQAELLLDLAHSQSRLLHVEHIELLGSLHQTFKQHLPALGNCFYARYVTINAQRPAPDRWTYHRQQFGFPLMAALSRLHRFTDLFGTVVTVSCQNRYWGEGENFKACLCTARLNFTQGLVAEVTYGKGEVFWQEARDLAIHGDQATLAFVGDQGSLIRGEGVQEIALGSRRGLFALDSKMVIDHLIAGTPLYTSANASFYTLKVAEAARVSALSGQTIAVSDV